MNLIKDSFKIMFSFMKTSTRVAVKRTTSNPFTNFFKFLAFGIIQEEKGAKFLSEKNQKQILNSDNIGLLIDGDKKRLTDKVSYNHLSVIAKTGAGKTTSFIYPNIFTLSNQNNSILVSDPSGELFKTTSKYMETKGFNVLLLDPSNLEKSIRYNPLANIKTFSQVGKIAQTLVLSENPNPKDPFWNAGAETIIEIFIQCLLNQPIEYRNLNNVLFLLQRFGNDGKPVEDFVIDNAFNIEDPKDQSIYNKWLGFLSNSDKARASLIATANSALRKLGNPEIAQLMATNTIDFKDFRRRKTIIYLCTPSHEARYYSFILNLFYTQFFNFCMEQPYNPHKDLPIYVLYDEFGHSSIPEFSTIITTIRKYAVSISIILQSISQLEERYGRIGAETILSGGIASKLFYAGADLKTAEIIQSTLGRVKKEYDYKDGKEYIKESNLLNSDEIRTINDNEAIFITGNKHPILLNVKPYYENKQFSMFTKLGESKTKNNFNDKQLFYVKL